ncbi:MAG: hypothetical protein EHM48_09530 [Planctomycetaceae bacterium]|nr:MAG: hypothetical protein EHM48_09530 [Planctomycetaceae bacterium]
MTTLETPLIRGKPNYFDSFECRSGSHCIACRSRQEGVNFRAAIAAYFAVPADQTFQSSTDLTDQPHAQPSEQPSTDWDCPYGRPWEFDGNIQLIPHREQVLANLPFLDVPTITKQQILKIPAGAIAACKSCGERICPNVTVCCGGQVSVNIIVPCPHGRW